MVRTPSPANFDLDLKRGGAVGIASAVPCHLTSDFLTDSFTAASLFVRDNKELFPAN